MRLKHYFWRASNLYGWLFGFAALAPLHRIFLNLSLHGLGYDNARHTGEEWFIKNILAKENPQTCIDVGANVGAYSDMLARYTHAAVYAIEPASAAFAELEKTAANYPGRIHSVNAALGDRTGTATLYVREHLSEKATLDAAAAGSAIKEEVRLTTLDALADELQLRKIDFIKIDTEGYELEVFRGMHNTLETFKPKYIQFEFNHVHLHRAVTVYSLAQLLPEYELYRLLPHGWIKIDPAKMSANIFMFCNIVAKRRT